MLDLLNFVGIQIKGKTVLVTVPNLIRKTVNALNGKEILTSNFYYDILNEKQYLRGEEFVLRDCQQKYPVQYAEAIEQLRAMGELVTNATNLITYQGAFNILYAYGIDTKTLLQGGEKIPLKQNGLFPQPEPMEEPSEEDMLEQLFSSEKGLIKPQDLVSKKTSRSYSKRVYIRDLNQADENVVFGFNKELAYQLSTRFTRVQDTIDGLSSLFAQVYILDKNGYFQMVVRFVAEGTPNSVLLARSMSGDVVTNISLKRTKYSNHIIDTLLENGLSGIESRSMLIVDELQSVIIDFSSNKNHV